MRLPFEKYAFIAWFGVFKSSYVIVFSFWTFEDFFALLKFSSIFSLPLILLCPGICLILWVLLGMLGLFFLEWTLVCMFVLFFLGFVMCSENLRELYCFQGIACYRVWDDLLLLELLCLIPRYRLNSFQEVYKWRLGFRL